MIRFASTLALLAAALAASAQNLVQDPSFENHGSFDANAQAYAFGPAWNSNTSLAAQGVFDNYQDQQSHSGGFYAYLDNSPFSAGTLSQTIATEIGRSYTASFYLQNYDFVPGRLNFLTATFGNGSLSLTNVAESNTYALYSFTGTATSALSVLRFQESNTDYFFLDDISVVANPTPEPSAFAALGLGAVVMLRRRR